MGKGQVSSPEPLTTLGSVLSSSSLHETTQSQAALAAGEPRLGAKMLQNLASKALTFKVLFDSCPVQHIAAKNHKKHKDKWVDGQRPGLKSRTFDNFGFRPLFIFSS
jgi:hypothetical protein